MVISDAHEGLTAVVGQTVHRTVCWSSSPRKVPGAGWQRCRVHFQRTLPARMDKTSKPVVSAAVKTVFAEKNRDQAHARWREVADSLRDRVRDVAELMDGEGVKRSLRWSDHGPNEHGVLAHMAFDETLRAKLHGTNPPERAGKEIKRRTNPVGIFPNREAVIVPGAYAAPPGPRSPVTVGALMLEQNDAWAFRGLRRATGATVPSTPPRHAGGKADGPVQRSRGGDHDRRPVNERHQP